MINNDFIKAEQYQLIFKLTLATILICALVVIPVLIMQGVLSSFHYSIGLLALGVLFSVFYLVRMKQYRENLVRIKTTFKEYGLHLNVSNLGDSKVGKVTNPFTNSDWLLMIDGNSDFTAVVRSESQAYSFNSNSRNLDALFREVAITIRWSNLLLPITGNDDNWIIEFAGNEKLIINNFDITVSIWERKRNWFDVTLQTENTDPIALNGDSELVIKKVTTLC
ncbi:hypothetical protein [Photobacterium leiognathi]|uniref:hypothetical protein n=1 Tax=Photobacterium leiognathi TaxID=553611 RepID=UPI002981AB3B|nr:hypothetical protein [Photobacterium leiognathi]